MKKYFRKIKKVFSVAGTVALTIPGMFIVGFLANAIFGIWAIPLYILIAYGGTRIVQKSC